MAGDQQAALFGQGCFSPGDAKNTYGTGCFLLMNTGDKPCASRNGLLTTVAVGLDGGVQYALEGSVFVGGAVIQWLRDELRFFPESRDAEYYAQKVPDNGGVYLVPAFTGLGAPYWDMYARGILVGLTRGTRREHITRAAQESIAYQVADLVHAMEADTGLPLGQLKADGGASRDAFLMQFQADILDREVRRPPPSGRPPPWGQPIWLAWPPGCGAVPASCAACGGATPPSPPPCRRSSGSACWSSGTGRWAAAGTGPGRKSTHLPFFPFLYPLVIWAAVG